VSNKDWMQPWMRARLGLVYILFVVFFGFVAYRLVQLQILEDASLSKLAKKQFELTKRKAIYRLSILDRNGEELAVNITSASIFARPKLVRQKKKSARQLSKVLGGTVNSWYRKLKKSRPFIWIKRQISDEAADNIKKRRLRGIFVVPEKKRFYPNGMLASNILGFTDIDGKGLAGVELMLDKELRLEQSTYRFTRDGKGKPSYIARKQVKRMLQDKGGIYLTIDRRLQFALEEELEKTLKLHSANAVMAVVMDPFTGEILALGQRPTFDPNRVQRFNNNLYANKLISYVYEPGSTLKVLFAAEALEQNLLNVDTPLDCGGGSVTIGRTKIREADSHHHFKTLPLKKVIQYSSNVGAVRIAQILGPKRVRDTLKKFGLTRRSGIGLPGESRPVVKKAKEWTSLINATVAFGQGVAFTPLQLVKAFAPFANGGYLVEPRILLRDLTLESEKVREGKRILSALTVERMKQILVSITEDKKGTGVKARVPGLVVAGKTGTAQKYVAGKGYSNGKYFASFVGFLPADRPQLLIGVMVDEPQKQYYATQVAAPLFSKIAERSMQILDRVPRMMVAQNTKHSEKKGTHKKSKLRLVRSGKKKFIMPNLQGLSIREAIRGIGKSFPNIKVSGFGFVHSQTPKAGTVIQSKTPIHLQFTPAG